MSNIYKKCQKITNTKSKEYKKYRDQTNQYFNEIICAVVFNLMLDVPFIFQLMGPLTPKAREYIMFYLAALIGTTFIFFWRKIKNSNFFYQFSDWKALSTHINIQNYDLLYEQATKQLTKNKAAVKLSFKLLRNVFIIFVVGIFEDNIKQYICTWFNNLGSPAKISEAFVLMLVIIILLLKVCPMISYLISYLIFLFNFLATYLEHIVDTCIDNGMFVKNYALLNATIKILETEYKNKSQNQ